VITSQRLQWNAALYSQTQHVGNTCVMGIVLRRLEISYGYRSLIGTIALASPF